jgi:hypothetical protein
VQDGIHDRFIARMKEKMPALTVGESARSGVPRLNDFPTTARW